MAKTVQRLSARLVETIRKPGMHHDGAGLYFQTTGTNARSWLLRYTSPVTGRRRDMGIGPYPTVGLAAARQAALDARRLIAGGIDPVDSRKAAQAAQRAAAPSQADQRPTFREVAEQYLRAHLATWTHPEHRRQWRHSLDAYCYPELADVPVEAVSLEHVLRVLEPIWYEKPEAANRTRGRIEQILDAAAVRGMRGRENPARWKGGIEHLLPARAKIRPHGHFRALAYTEIPALMTKLQEKRTSVTFCLRFAILTAARVGEATGAVWSEIDTADEVWSIPGSKMKNRKPHRVPLAPQVIELLHSVPRRADFVFARRDGSNESLSRLGLWLLLNRMDVPGTTHGFRSSFRDWCADCTDYPAEIAEAALAHTQPSRLVAAYRRTDYFDKRRVLMTEWANYCTGGK